MAAREIKLTCGKVALVDAEDYVYLGAYRWWANKDGYPVREQWQGGRRKTIYMHRAVWEQCQGPIPPGLTVDHADLDKLNNCRGNLRLSYPTLQIANQRKRAGCRSSYRGVTWSKAAGRWRARIKAFGRERLLGYFDDEAMAAAVYDGAARETFGEYARVNFPGTGER